MIDSSCLPQLQLPHTGPVSSPATEERHKPKRLLLVEDNPTNANLAMRMLAETDYTIDCARNGLQACTQAEENEYDVILMDVMVL